MSKLISVAAYLKAILVALSIALTRGDMLPVIVVSALFSLAQLNTKPIGQTELRDPAANAPNQDRSG